MSTHLHPAPGWAPARWLRHGQRQAILVVLGLSAGLAGLAMTGLPTVVPKNPPRSTASAAAAPADLAAFRRHWMQRTYQDPQAVLSELREEQQIARVNGDTHAAWMLLAWLVRSTAVFDPEAARTLHALAETEIERALAAGDRVATFELALMVEAMGVQQFARAADPQRLALLQQLADEIGEPLQHALLLKLRGMLASHAGEDGQALFHLEQALSQLSGELERAEVQMLMAIALVDNPTASAANLAIAHLDEVVRGFPPEQYPGMLTPILRLSLMLSRVQRHPEALQMAQRALQVARRRGLEADLARAYVVVGQAWLAAGDCRRALDGFNSAPPRAMSAGYELQAHAGRALCLARLGDTAAREAIQQASARGASLHGASRHGLAQFHDTLADAWLSVGDSAAALASLQTASALRRTLAATAQNHLATARNDVFSLKAQAQSHAQRRPWLLAGAATLALFGVGVAVIYRRQRQQHRAAAHAVQQQAQLHQHHLGLSEALARQLEASCQALRQPAQALALLMRSDGVPTSSADVQRRHMTEVKHLSRSFIESVDALLDRLRLQDGSYVPQLERFDLSLLLREIGQQVGPLVAQKGLTWTLQTEACGVSTDRHLLRRILLNLLDHVVHHAEQGGITLRLQPHGATHALEVSCSDTQAPALRSLAKDQRATLQASEDLGCGLGTAGMACDLLGHALTVTHSPVFGLTIRLELPVASPPTKVAEPPRVAATGRSVALVEDDAFSRITLMNALVDAGLEVQAYASFEELMAPGPAQSVPGLLISDLHLGDYGDATEALRALRRRPEWRDVPVLMLTGDIRDEVNALASELGVALAYKPISVRRMLERIALLRGPQPLPATPRAATAGRADGR